MKEIWILGATGRSGRAAAAQLAGQFPLVLVGRDPARLRDLAATLGGEVRTVAAGSVDAIAAEISRGQPAVVVNTIGPFTGTALPFVRACPPGTHYADLNNELLSFLDVLGLHEEAVSTGRTVVTGVGFGVLATESVVLKLCAGQPPAETVRVDAMPYVEPEPGPLGIALAATIMDVLAAGGRQYARGQLVRTRLLSDLETLTLPDGSPVKTASGASGELEAARCASGASFAAAASSMVPPSAAVRAVLPAALTLLRIKALRNLATRRVAAIQFKSKPPQARREFSWAHARVQWASGTRREGFLRLGDAMTFTTAVVVEVVSRLARQEGRPGAYTPGALFGPELAVKAGGEFILD